MELRTEVMIWTAGEGLQAAGEHISTPYFDGYFINSIEPSLIIGFIMLLFQRRINSVELKYP